MTAAALDDIWQMRVDGQLHSVPVMRVPVHACLPCETYLLDGSSDEVVLYWYNRYCIANGLHTPWRRLFRWCRRRIAAWQTRIWLARRNFARKLGYEM
jgi:hypothetical protein